MFAGIASIADDLGGTVGGEFLGDHHVDRQDDLAALVFGRVKDFKRGLVQVFLLQRDADVMALRARKVFAMAPPMTRISTLPTRLD
jgi:hypothetical protein